MRFGARIAVVRGVIIGLDRVDVDVVGVGLDVDERGHEAGPHHRRDVGGERDRGRDDLVAGRQQPSSSTARYERGGARVAHHPASLAEQLGDAAARTPRTLLPMRSAVDGPRSTSTTAAISSSSCTLPA